MYKKNQEDSYKSNWNACILSKRNFRDKNKYNKLKIKTYQKVINLNKNIDKIIKLLQNVNEKRDINIS